MCCRYALPVMNTVRHNGSTVLKMMSSPGWLPGTLSVARDNTAECRRHVHSRPAPLQVYVQPLRYPPTRLARSVAARSREVKDESEWVGMADQAARGRWRAAVLRTCQRLIETPSEVPSDSRNRPNTPCLPVKSTGTNSGSAVGQRSGGDAADHKYLSWGGLGDGEAPGSLRLLRFCRIAARLVCGVNTKLRRHLHTA